jgi:HEAT repeat protein
MTVIDVNVCTLSGNQLQFSVEPHETIRHLKSRLETHFQARPECQKLIVDCCPLEDEKTILDYCHDDSSDQNLSIVYVHSHAEVIASIRAGRDDPVRCYNLKILAALQLAGDADAVEVAMECLHTGDRSVKVEALRVLGHASEKGDKMVIARISKALVECTGKWNAPVRAAAARSLSELAGNAYQLVIDQLRICAVEDEDEEVRTAAIMGLASLASAEKLENGIPWIVECLEHDREHVRRTVATALPHILSKGDDLGISLVFRSATVDPAIALTIIPHIVEKGDHDSIERVMDYLRDDMADVRCESLRVLTQIVERGDESVVEATILLTRDVDAQVRRVATAALMKISLVGDESVLLAIRSCLEDPNPGVRSTASTVLKQLRQAAVP